jgi:hypothetical protein
MIFQLPSPALHRLIVSVETGDSPWLDWQPGRVEPQPTWKELLSALPVDFLNVVVHRHRQAMATFCPAAFEHFTTVGGRHASAKAVHAHPATNLGLVSSFGHPLSLSDY